MPLCGPMGLAAQEGPVPWVFKWVKGHQPPGLPHSTKALDVWGKTGKQKEALSFKANFQMDLVGLCPGCREREGRQGRGK